MSSTDVGPVALIPVTGIGEVTKGCDIAELIVQAVKLEPLDVVVVTQKIVSKSEDRIIQLQEDDTAGFIALVEAESRRILRRRGDLMITETHHGFVCANAGIDRSNTDPNTVALLPLDPDLSARRIRRKLMHLCGFEVAVVITDTFGRTWRNGVIDVAIGCDGVAAIVDLRGTLDSMGRTLQATEICLADEIASAADLVKPKSGNVPVVIVRGLLPSYFRGSSIQNEVIRDPQGDLFR